VPPPPPQAVAKFIVPDWGLKLTPAQGCRTGPSGYIGWQANTTILYAGVNYIPHSGTMNLASEFVYIFKDSSLAAEFVYIFKDSSSSLYLTYNP
jgi:hypothetical protein